MEDAIRLNVIKLSDVPTAELKLLGTRKAEWIGTLITAVVNSSIKSECIDLFGDVADAFMETKRFRYKNVYSAGETQEQQQVSRRAIKLAFNYNIIHKKYSKLDQKTAAHRTLDDIACMTDTSLTSFVKEKFVPQEKY